MIALTCIRTRRQSTCQRRNRGRKKKIYVVIWSEIAGCHERQDIPLAHGRSLVFQAGNKSTNDERNEFSFDGVLKTCRRERFFYLGLYCIWLSIVCCYFFMDIFWIWGQSFSSCRSPVTPTCWCHGRKLANSDSQINSTCILEVGTGTGTPRAKPPRPTSFFSRVPRPEGRDCPESRLPSPFLFLLFDISFWHFDDFVTCNLFSKFRGFDLKRRKK